MATLTLDRVDKLFSGGHHAVREMNLHVHEGEFLVLVGPSGCGKSTALRIIAGIETQSSGDVLIDGRRVNDLTPQERNLAMVFQDFALYPHMTARQNIAFPLGRERLHHLDVDARVESVAKALHLTDLLDNKPNQMSGGQRQRVAMARAIIRQPAAFLMDEPLSNLDAKLRVQTRSHIARLHARLGVTTVYVTHDQVEAMTLGTRVAVMRDGVIVQLGTPQELYDRPDDTFVASFMGSPAMNMYGASLSGTTITIGRQQLSVPASVFERRPALRNAEDREVILGIRPEDFEDAAIISRPDPSTMLHGEVAFIEGLGSELLVHFTLDAPRYEVPDTDPTPQVYGRPVSVGRFDPSSSLSIYAPLAIAVDVDNLHFFDPVTTGSIWT